MRPIVRVLLVTDDWPDGAVNGGFLRWTDQASADATGRQSRQFHLGEFVKVLEATTWSGFDVEITKAHRTPTTSSGTPAQIAADRGADVVNFRFGQAFTVNGQARKLSDYDMVLLFAIEAGEPLPSLAGEAEAISQFMEAGGGFFATGDHANLGAPLCGLIPRVRSMRRWWVGTGPGSGPTAPSPDMADRHDTTQPGPDGITNFEDQSDEVAQPIVPTLYAAGLTSKQGYVARKYLPHPLLCSPQGMVKFLPDHMHEGWCEVPAKLDGTFSVGGNALREYPDYTPANPPPGFVPQPLAPEVVATGHVRLNTTSPALDTEAHTGGKAPTNEMTFGVIGAWDGHRVAKGRVVVDSTWHHFFNINLTGDRFLDNDSLGPQHEQKRHGFYVPDGSGGRVACDEYKMIQWYFRNIVYWLIPAKRHKNIFWSTLQEVIRTPRLSEELGVMVDLKHIRALRLDHVLYFAQLAEDYLAQARGACATYTIRVILYKPIIPWWEWIQEIADVWDPIEKALPKSRFKDLRKDLVSGALGVGPQPELLGRVALGAAVLSAALARAGDRGQGEPERIATAAAIALPEVTAHFAGLLGEELKNAVASSKRLLEASTQMREFERTGEAN